MKKALGFLAVLTASAMLMCASAYAATTYSVATVKGEAGNTVTVPVTATADTTGEQINGYVVTFKYDPAKVTPVAQGKDAADADCYAAAGEKFADGVLVADSIDNTDGTKTLAVAWAAANPVTLTQDELTQLADVDFTVAAGVTENVTLEVQAATVAKNGTDAPASVEVASGAIELNSGILGDVNDDGNVDGTDVTLLTQYVNKVVTDLETTYPGADYRSNVNEDASVDGTDVTLLTQYVNKVITAFK